MQTKLQSCNKYIPTSPVVVTHVSPSNLAPAQLLCTHVHFSGCSPGGHWAPIVTMRSASKISAKK